MTVMQLYTALEQWLPATLSCEWDNDGLMCCPDPEAPVKRVLFTLDVTEEAVAYAIRGGFDLLVSHHPLIFRPLTAIVDPKLIRLTQSGIAVMSFHTRLDAAEGGVNDALAARLGLEETARFHPDGIGVIGYLPQPMTEEDFASLVKARLGVERIEIVTADRLCHRVAVVGGEGKDYVAAAVAAGADTFLTGSMGYHPMTDAAGLGVSIVTAGHYHTEQPVLARLAERVTALASEVSFEIYACNRIQIR